MVALSLSLEPMNTVHEYLPYPSNKDLMAEHNPEKFFHDLLENMPQLQHGPNDDQNCIPNDFSSI